MSYFYSVYNLIIQSELLLTNLPPVSAGNESKQVTISYGRVRKEDLPTPVHQGFLYQATSTYFWLNIPSVAQFLISNGQSIIIDPIDGIDEDSIRAFLYAICLEMLLRQRQLIVLSGYALQMGECGIAFLGGTGHATSLRQGLFYKRGYSFLADGFVALNNQGIILPGVAQINFWPSVVATLKLDVEELKTLRPNNEKLVLPLKEQYCSSPFPLKIIYTIKTHQQPDLFFSKVDKPQKLDYLQQLSGLNNSASCFESNRTLSSEVFNNIQMICIHLPATGLKLQLIADSIENNLNERGHNYVQS